MRLSNTAIKELKKRYKNILIKCAMLNAAALLAFATPAMAEISAPLDYDGTSGTINEDIKISTTNDDGIVFSFASQKTISSDNPEIKGSH